MSSGITHILTGLQHICNTTLWVTKTGNGRFKNSPVKLVTEKDSFSKLKTEKKIFEKDSGCTHYEGTVFKIVKKGNKDASFPKIVILYLYC